MLVDIHTHLEDKQFQEDLNLVIERSKQKGVVSIINNGTNPETNRKTIELAKKFSIIRPALGLYPVEAIKLSQEEIDIEIKFIKKNKPAAIGEVGLDYFWINDKKEEMKTAFEKMIKLAKEIDVPIIVHSRKAEQDCIEMLEKSGMKKIIMHCFGGNLNLIKRIIHNKWYFSIPPTIVYDKHFQRIVELSALSHLFTETDSPYLAPVKGERNEPVNVHHTVKRIAEIKLMDAEEVMQNIYLNYQRVFC